jgi:hypothetical protein
MQCQVNRDGRDKPGHDKFNVVVQMGTVPNGARHRAGSNSWLVSSAPASWALIGWPNA